MSMSDAQLAEAIGDLAEAIWDDAVWQTVPKAATNVLWRLRMIARRGAIPQTSAA